jgi:hypothetical protein
VTLGDFLFLSSLQVYAAALRRDAHIPFPIWRHVCGKLLDFSKVAQEAHDRLTYCWAYLEYGSTLSASGMSLLLEDLDWWIAKLALWAAGDLAGCEYPIVTRHSLLNTPGAISVLVSDASGIDGFGGIVGDLYDPDPRVFSVLWPADALPSSSYVGELAALRYDLEQRLLARQMSSVSPAPAPLLLLWVTDNQGAAQSINSGRTHTLEGRLIMHDIFRLAGLLKLTLVALWHSREFNTFADYLSHLAALMNQSRVDGRGPLPRLTVKQRSSARPAPRAPGRPLHGSTGSRSSASTGATRPRRRRTKQWPTSSWTSC